MNHAELNYKITNNKSITENPSIIIRYTKIPNIKYLYYWICWNIGQFESRHFWCVIISSTQERFWMIWIFLLRMTLRTVLQKQHRRHYDAVHVTCISSQNCMNHFINCIWIFWWLFDKMLHATLFQHWNTTIYH